MLDAEEIEIVKQKVIETLCTQLSKWANNTGDFTYTLLKLTEKLLPSNLFKKELA
jgi:hypothetical protein